MDAIAVIGVSRTSVRVVLTTGRVVYQGKWKLIPSYIDIGKRDAAYIAEFKALAMHMKFRQCGVQDVQVFENGKVA